MNKTHIIPWLYGAEMDFPYREAEPEKTYSIAAIPRTGSTYFSIMLWRQGVFGSPMEYLNIDNVPHIRNRLCKNEDMETYWREVVYRRTSQNGVFGYKSFLSNFFNISKKYPEWLKKITPDYLIYLTREDKIAQAVSYARAIKTKAWFAGVRPQATPEYDYDMIKLCETNIKKQEDMWERFFKVKEITPLRLEYNYIKNRPEETIEKISSFLGIRTDKKYLLDVPYTKVQSDNTSKEWVEKYKEDLEKNK